ncbi:MAG TPA: hypothetical protein VF267_07900 [Gammaproteobacteria bacterium]
MNCHAARIDLGGALTESRDPSMTTQYLAERPRLVLAVLDLMETFGCKEAIPFPDHEEARHAS